MGTYKNHIRHQFKPNKTTVNQLEKCLLLAPLTRPCKPKIGAVCGWGTLMPAGNHACLQAPNMSSQHGIFSLFFRLEWNEWSMDFPISIGVLQCYRVSKFPPPNNICSTALHHPSWLHSEPWWQWRTWSSSDAKKANGECLVRKC